MGIIEEPYSVEERLTYARSLSRGGVPDHEAAVQALKDVNLLDLLTRDNEGVRRIFMRGFMVELNRLGSNSRPVEDRFVNNGTHSVRVTLEKPDAGGPRVTKVRLLGAQYTVHRDGEKANLFVGEMTPDEGLEAADGLRRQAAGAYRAAECVSESAIAAKERKLQFIGDLPPDVIGPIDVKYRGAVQEVDDASA